MRGDDEICGSLFSYVDLEERVRADHPLRVIRELANAALRALSGAFAPRYSPIGRGSIPPERLMRALLLQAFYSIRSERQLVERIEYDLLFRWFVGLGIDDPAWDATTFTKNRAPRTATGCWPAKAGGYDSGDFVMELREQRVTPHLAQNQNRRRSAIKPAPAQAGGRTTGHPGYAVSLRIRKRIEEAFGWAKTVAGLRKMRHRGLPKLDWQFTLAMAAYDLVRLPKLLAQAAP